MVDFVDRVYVQHDLAGFTGDPQFVQNDYAKRIFSKLRSSFAGVYAWRLGTIAPKEYRPKSQTEYTALASETDSAPGTVFPSQAASAPSWSQFARFPG